MRKLYLLGGVAALALAGTLGACAEESSALSEPPSPALEAVTAQAAATGGLRLRCERRSNRSKISVDGRNLNPRNAVYRARVRAAGCTATSGTQRAAGGEAEFDFDSNRNDINEGATRIAASFIRARPGADVVGEILDAQGRVVATRGAECEAK